MKNLEIRERLLPDDSNYMAEIYNNLGEVYRIQGKYYKKDEY
jgi:hypothetical protein